ncbi:hypothetical protein M3589_24215 [Heyndrickxia oleronia]|uniref:Uncharacterized protein n=1 Tax=Heyndrickxia oleronia TaxID=38875 RepID=A0AAW6T564_9BACI|nr:hypothetical protein [Heyndrickxia oleronia]MCM3240765.1 hypothetical protein [Heyndrickxia oleronia]MDH5163431.1 hypothetical protein [Heyndrickxia oleronia]GIN41462.1 hypothetical protein J19TS1_44110 [Heyndrickxia oleronia]
MNKLALALGTIVMFFGLLALLSANSSGQGYFAPSPSQGMPYEEFYSL